MAEVFRYNFIVRVFIFYHVTIFDPTAVRSFSPNLIESGNERTAGGQKTDSSSTIDPVEVHHISSNFLTVTEDNLPSEQVSNNDAPPSSLEVDAQYSTSEGEGRYVIACTASGAQIVYGKIGDGITAPRPLVESGLKKPVSLAVDPIRRILYVADKEEKKVGRYQLEIEYDGKIRNDWVLKANEISPPAAEGITPTAVVVDGNGDIFFSTFNEKNKKAALYQVDPKHPANPILLYSKLNPELIAPTSLYSDNFFLYWNNGVDGNTPAVSRAPQKKPQYNPSESAPPGLSVMAGSFPNGLISNGVCAIGDVMYVTASNGGGTGSLYRISKSSPGEPVTMEDSSLDIPQQCVADGDAGLLVSDKQGIWSYSGAMARKSGMKFSKELMFSLPGATGLAVFSTALDRTGGSSTFGKVLSFLAVVVAIAVLGHFVLNH